MTATATATATATENPITRSENEDGELERTTTMENPRSFNSEEYAGLDEAEIRSVDESGSSVPRRALLEPVVDHGPWVVPMLEVFSVRLVNISREYQGHLYGKITVEHGGDPECIFNRDREHSESIGPGDIALLTGPTEPILAYDSFSIHVALTYEYNDWLVDNEVIKGYFSWNVYKLTNKYDQPLFQKVGGLFSWVIVNYAVFSDAVEAIVEVMLINGDEEKLAKLYGKLTARNSDFMNESFESVLFHKTLDKGVYLSHGQLIPLSRSSVAVPFNSSLIVEANLRDSSNEDEIAKGTADFLAQPYSTSEKNISGEYGEIKVKVSWVNR